MGVVVDTIRGTVNVNNDNKCKRRNTSIPSEAMDVIVEGLEEHNIEIKKTRTTYTLKGTPEAWDEVYPGAFICRFRNNRRLRTIKASNIRMRYSRAKERLYYNWKVIM